jgi:hypothetical protein
VAELFRLVFEVGGAASVGTLAGVFADLDVVAQAALDLAARGAETAADDRLASLAREGGVRRLLEEARRQKLPAAFDETDDLGRLEYELEGLAWGPGRLRSVLPLLLTPRGLNEPWARLVDQLRSREVARRLPRQPYRFRSVRYENPLVLEIVSGGGVAAWALVALLGVIRDWGPRRRVKQAAAADAEDQAWSRQQLRRFAVRQVSEGELELTSDVVRDLFSDGLVDAVGRLSAREPEVERSELPGE